VAINRTIKRILFISFWLLVGAGMFFLMAAAISKKNKERFREYTIAVKGNDPHLFVDKQMVEGLLKTSTAGIKGELMAAFNLRGVEAKLEKQVWIRDAELFFDNQEVLHVTITEKTPIARIFSTNGDSYYLDELGLPMPLSEKGSAKVPVFTGIPVLAKKLTITDSVLLDQTKNMALFILKDSFWMSQITQVNLTKDGQFEMIPLLGDQVIRMGDGQDIEAKFKRLWIFYQQVLSKTGMNKYKLIDVQYKDQVVASRTGGPHVDSLLLKHNVDDLIRASKNAENDTVIKRMPIPSAPLLPDPDVEIPIDTPTHKIKISNNN
jgi:cell division protein FtsQ